MTDSTGEWQVVGRPYTTAGGKNSHVRVQRVDSPDVTEVRIAGVFEKVSVKGALRAQSHGAGRSLSKSLAPLTCLCRPR